MKPVSYISGATGYIGLKLTEHLARQGKNLVLSAQHEDQLLKLVKNISKKYPKQSFRGFTCNLAIPESWQSTKSIFNECIVNEYINCSGMQGVLGSSLEISYKETLNVFNVNLFSGIFFTNYFVSRLKEGEKLSIIHFSGGGATSPRPLFMSYSLSKTSLLRFIENFAVENWNRDIKVNAIAPGVLPSKMQSEIIGNQKLRNSKDYMIALESLSAGDLETTKLLNLCDFLLADKSDGITGKLISVDWDNWAEWPNHLDELRQSDIYTLRRINSRDRGHEWGDL